MLVLHHLLDKVVVLVVLLFWLLVRLKLWWVLDGRLLVLLALFVGRLFFVVLNLFLWPSFYLPLFVLQSFKLLLSSLVHLLPVHFHPLYFPLLNFLLPLYSFKFLILQFWPVIALLIIINYCNFIQTLYELFKWQVPARRWYLFKYGHDGRFGDDFFGLWVDLCYCKAEISQKKEKSFGVEVLPFVFESVESHVFADFEDVSTVVLEYLLEVVES